MLTHPVEPDTSDVHVGRSRSKGTHPSHHREASGRECDLRQGGRIFIHAVGDVGVEENGGVTVAEEGGVEDQAFEAAQMDEEVREFGHAGVRSVEGEFGDVRTHMDAHPVHLPADRPGEIKKYGSFDMEVVVDGRQCGGYHHGTAANPHTNLRSCNANNEVVDGVGDCAVLIEKEFIHLGEALDGEQKDGPILDGACERIKDLRSPVEALQVLRAIVQSGDDFTANFEWNNRARAISDALGTLNPSFEGTARELLEHGDERPVQGDACGEGRYP